MSPFVTRAELWAPLEVVHAPESRCAEIDGPLIETFAFHLLFAPLSLRAACGFPGWILLITTIWCEALCESSE